MIIFLVKIYQSAEHADAFVGGTMYANRLSYFKKIGDTGGVRGDADEGAIFLSQNGLFINLWRQDSTKGEADKIVISENDLAAPVVIHPRWWDHLNLFCMYAGHTGSFDRLTDQNLHEFRQHLLIPDDCVELGTHAVVITNTPEFFKRVKVGVERMGYRVWGRLVKYYDADVGMEPTYRDMESLFLKRKEYEYQKEYRLAIDTDTIGTNPICLDIGSIEDISIRINTEDINRGLKIEKKS